MSSSDKGKYPLDDTTDDGIQLTNLIPFMEKIQAKGGFSLVDAYVVKSAMDFLSEKDQDSRFIEQLSISDPSGQKVPPQAAASQIIVSSIVKGQEKGVFTIAEAAQLAIILKLVKA